MGHTTPPSNSPIPIPGSAANPPGIPPGIIGSEIQKQIFENLVESGRNAIFQNPIVGVLNGLGEEVTGLYDAVTNSTCLSGGEKTQITNALGTGGIGGLSAQLSEFSTHVQILSGVLPQGANATPGLEKILSVGRSLGNLSSAVDGITDCLSIFNGMTALFSGPTLTGFANEIAGMIAAVNNCLADVTEIVSRITAIASIIQNIINADRNFFAEALDILAKSAISSILESIYSNPCGKLLLEQIGTQKLIGILR